MIRRWYQSRAYAILFFSLLATMVATPLLSDWRLGDAILDLFLTVNLTVAILGIERLRGRRVYLIVIIGLVVLRSLRTRLPSHLFEIASLFALAAIAVLAAVMAARRAFGAKRVDSEHIFAALSAYLLAGIFLGLVHFGIENISPGSYLMSNLGTPPERGDLDNMVYFSFVTLATLGYGDMVPVSPTARGLAVFEAVAGQLYLAVLIARLVSLYTTQRDRS